MTGILFFVPSTPGRSPHHIPASHLSSALFSNKCYPAHIYKLLQLPLIYIFLSSFCLASLKFATPSLYLRYLPALVPFFFLYLAAFHIMTAFYFCSSKHCFLPSHASCSKHIFFKRHTWSYFSDADWTWKIEMPPTLFFCCCVLIQRTILFFSIGWKLLTMHFYYELANI